MRYTANYNLKKPDGSDTVNIEDFNNNADIIDDELKSLENTIENLDADGITLPDGKTISEKFTEITKEIGKLEELDTETKLSLVAAINEIYGKLAEHKAEKVQHLSYAIASGTNAYTSTINGISSLVEGMSIKIKFTNANTGASALNINGLGAKPIQKSNGNALSSGNIKAGQIVHLVYTGSVFQLLGEGGEYGTAQAQDVLEGKTIGTEEGIIAGTMPNNGAINRIITNQNGQIVVPEGYHDGRGIVKAQFANLIASNIRKGVNIGGVVGALTPLGTDITSKTGDWWGERTYTYTIDADRNVMFIQTETSNEYNYNGAYFSAAFIRGVTSEVFAYGNYISITSRNDSSITIKTGQHLHKVGYRIVQI